MGFRARSVQNSREQRKRAKRAGRPAARKPAEPAVTPCVVSIVASAGGFEAVRKLLSTAPADGRLAFVVVQHLDPRHKSRAAELLGPRTALTVAEARDGQEIEPDHVYMVPAASEVTVAGNRLRLNATTASSRPPPRTELGRREREVLQLVAAGLRGAEIARRLHIAESTVEVHRRNIMRKLDLHGVVELTRYAIREGLSPL
jgi:two-component system NarL family response regulator